MSTNAQGTISNENETLSMQKCNALPVNRNAQGTISDGNETQLMYRHTACAQEYTGYNQ